MDCGTPYMCMEICGKCKKIEHTEIHNGIKIEYYCNMCAVGYVFGQNICTYDVEWNVFCVCMCVRIVSQGVCRNITHILFLTFRIILHSAARKNF